MKDRVVLTIHLLETKSVQHHILQAGGLTCTLDALKKGWAFKEEKVSRPFSEKQHKYLTEKFKAA